VRGTPAGGSGTKIALQRSQTPPQEHPRVHLDLHVADAAEQAAEAERLAAMRRCSRLRMRPRPHIRTLLSACAHGSWRRRPGCRSSKVGMPSKLVGLAPLAGETTVSQAK
jgi:hypothetical protein